MLPIKLVIHHYRAIRDCEVVLSDYTALVGQNGAGKSTVLQALRFFFQPALSVSDADVHQGYDDDVSVSVTLAELSDRERELYAEFLQPDGFLTVTKRARPETGATFFVRSKVYPSFAPLRAMYGEKASVFSAQFKRFADDHAELELERPRAAADQKLALRKWELDHPDLLVEADMPFTFPEASKTDLIPSTRLLYVPAVHEASEDFEGTRSTLSRLISDIVMPRIHENADFLALQMRFQEDYAKLFETGLSRELYPLATKLTQSLQEFVPGATISLDWETEVPTISPPLVRSSVSDDGPQISVDRQGHGLQRAIIMALLKTYDEYVRTARPQESSDPVHICLLIEEPELYQHPPRARHFRRLLRRLASEAVFNARFRVMVTTHSPHFVSLADLSDVRLVRRVTHEGVTRRDITGITVAQVCAYYHELTGEDLAEVDVQRNLHVLEPLKEAFFASSIVLTEGPSDVGVLSAACRHEAFDYEANGMVFAAMGGKGVLRQAIVIVKLLGIQAYVVFDGDTKERLSEDRRLLRLLQAAESDIPHVGTPPELIRPNYAMLQKDMESTLKRDFGEAAYKQSEQEVAQAFGMAASRVSKNPVSAEQLVSLLYGRHLTSPTLEKIISFLRSL